VPVIRVHHVKEGGKAAKTKTRTVGVSVLGSNFKVTTNRHRFQLIQTEPVGERVKPVTLKVGIYDGDEPVTYVETVTFDSMVPFVENNYNCCEPGPRGTGKSHIYREISPNNILISGGQTTVANLLYTRRTWVFREARCVDRVRAQGATTSNSRFYCEESQRRDRARGACIVAENPCVTSTDSSPTTWPSSCARCASAPSPMPSTAGSSSAGT
jgi:hypothetical protein